MDPVSLGVMAAVSIGSSILGSATQAAGTATAAQGAQAQAAGAMALGQAQAQTYQYQAAIAQMNKQVAQGNEQYALAYGDTQAELAGLQTKAQIANTRVGFGASGLDVNTGSAKAVQESELNIGNYEQASIRSAYARQAYGYAVEGANYDAETTLDQMAATNAVTAGSLSATGYQTQAQTDMLNGAAGLLSSTGNISKSAFGMLSSGVFGAGAATTGTTALGGVALPAEALAAVA